MSTDDSGSTGGDLGDGGTSRSRPTGDASPGDAPAPGVDVDGETRTVPLLGVAYLTAVAWLPVVGYLVMIPYSVAVYAAVGPHAHPLVLVGVPELLLGTAYVAALRGDRRQLAENGSPWLPTRPLWYPAGFVLGATVLAAPVVSALYFWRRRGRTGQPPRGWLSTVTRGG